MNEIGWQISDINNMIEWRTDVIGMIIELEDHFSKEEWDELQSYLSEITDILEIKIKQMCKYLYSIMEKKYAKTKNKSIA